MPNPHALFVLLLTAAALYLFTRDKIPLEASALAILVTLLLAFQLIPYESAAGRLEPTRFLAGFGHEALITIAALMIIAKGLETTVRCSRSPCRWRARGPRTPARRS